MHRKFLSLDEKYDTAELKREKAFSHDVRKSQIKSPLRTNQNSKSELTDYVEIPLQGSPIRQPERR